MSGKQKINRWTKLSQLPATSKESDALSANLKKLGFKFVGSTIIYAHMQATGLVNDHLASCFRHKPCAKRLQDGKVLLYLFLVIRLTQPIFTCDFALLNSQPLV